uniref:Transmembrane protein n=1 Tax=Ignavibacterium album TaxID=591197 RepID=A0A7V2ZIC6_9BACT
MEYIKVIIFLVAIVFPLLLSNNKNLSTKILKFVKMILFIHLVLLFILIFKLHHLLRDLFNIPNTVTYLLSAIPFVMLINKFSTQLKSGESIYLIFSVFLLGLAVLLDLLTDGRIIVLQKSDDVEEYLRIAGAIFWLIYNYFLYSRLKVI